MDLLSGEQEKTSMVDCVPKKKRSGKQKSSIKGPFPFTNFVPEVRAAEALMSPMSQMKDQLLKLRNLLKLTKARRWVYCEFFYSDLDRELFLTEESEFAVCLRETFPSLRTRRLARTEWRWIRRMIGKPRRCSGAFFTEERAALNRRREKVRQVYRGTRVAIDNEEDYHEIPPRLLEPLKPGSRVLVRLRNLHDGLYLGTVDIVYECSRFRVAFDKETMEPAVVNDLDIASLFRGTPVPLVCFLEQNRVALALPTPGLDDTVSSAGGSEANQYLTKYLQQNGGKRPSTPGGAFVVPSVAPDEAARDSSCQLNGISGLHGTSSAQIMGPVSNPLLEDLESSLDDADYLGNFPTKLLFLVVKLNKLLKMKKQHIENLKDMNTEAERLAIFVDGYPFQLQQRYAQVLLDLEALNTQLTTHLSQVSDYTSSLVPDLSDVTVATRPDALRKLSLTHATHIVRNINAKVGVRSQRALELIPQLLSLLLQAKSLARRSANPYEMNALSETLSDISRGIDPRNRDIFQDCVEVHMSQLKAGLMTATSTPLVQSESSIAAQTLTNLYPSTSSA